MISFTSTVAESDIVGGQLRQPEGFFFSLHCEPCLLLGWGFVTSLARQLFGHKDGRKQEHRNSRLARHTLVGLILPDHILLVFEYVLDIVDLTVSKLSAIAPAVQVCDARRNRIDLLVGSAIAWKMSRLNIIVSPFDDTLYLSFFSTKTLKRVGAND